MSDNLNALEGWAGVLLAQMAPDARSTLARSIAQQLRRSQQQRILAQRNPDGSPYASRKPRNLRGKTGRVRRKAKMFQKLRTARFLKARNDSNAITLGFTGRISLIARVHQYGLKDRPARGAEDVRYKRREVLGFTEAEREMIRDELLAHIHV